MLWYSSLSEVHLYLAYASVIFFTLRALGVVFNIDLLKDGRTKVLAGETTIEEVLRVTRED